MTVWQILKSKQEFLEITKNGICKSDEFIAPWISEESLEVFPCIITVLYGAIIQ
jgi:hypothetical protein